MLSGMLVNSTGRAIGGILLGPIKCSIEVSKRNLNKIKNFTKFKKQNVKINLKKKENQKKKKTMYSIHFKYILSALTFQSKVAIHPIL